MDGVHGRTVRSPKAWRPATAEANILRNLASSFASKPSKVCLAKESNALTVLTECTAAASVKSGQTIIRDTHTAINTLDTTSNFSPRSNKQKGDAHFRLQNQPRVVSSTQHTTTGERQQSNRNRSAADPNDQRRNMEGRVQTWWRERERKNERERERERERQSKIGLDSLQKGVRVCERNNQ